MVTPVGMVLYGMVRKIDGWLELGSSEAFAAVVHTGHIYNPSDFLC